jgi:carbon-monoxide dehydrogenase medium subunit
LRYFFAVFDALDKILTRRYVKFPAIKVRLEIPRRLKATETKMYPAPIAAYYPARTVGEALKALADCGEDAVFIAGGMSLMQAIKARLSRPSALVDLNGIDELKGITLDADGVRIGSMTRYRDIAKAAVLDGAYQALRDAASTIGDRQVRNSGTIGGSLCWNYVASCMPNVNLSLSAVLDLLSTHGEGRRVAIGEFLVGPLETARQENELLIAVHLPPAPPAAGSAYKKYGGNVDGLPVIGVSAYVELDEGGSCANARIGVGGIMPCAQLFSGAADILDGSQGEAADLQRAADAASQAIETHDDHWASADYRKLLIRTLAVEVLRLAFDRARAG